MAIITFEQALYLRPDRQAPALIAHSDGFDLAWRDEAEALIYGFGDRPGITRCPLAIFAKPISKHHVAVVRVSDQSPQGLPGGLRFHFLVVERKTYQAWVCDPFILAEKIEPVWEASAPLPRVLMPEEAFSARTLEQVQTVLKRVKASALKEGEDPEAPDFERTPENSESPALLGGAQILMDGGKLVFERPEGDVRLASGLWLLLPERTRGRLWPTSFAFSDALDFDLLVAPRLELLDLEGYTTEEQAADYPEGKYELALQHAAESGTQRDLDEVFTRRDSRQTLRIALLLLAFFSVVLIVSKLLDIGVAPRTEPTNPLTARQQQTAAAVGIAAVGEPWTALGMIVHGKTLWKGEEKPRERQ
jgi:hypothetical protein